MNKQLENIDEVLLMGPGPSCVAPSVYEAIGKFERWRILVAPDHPTPVKSRAHSSEPVPFAMAGTDVAGILHTNFSEANAAKSGFRIENGFELMEYFLRS